MNSPTNEAINVLTDISQNFPMQVNIHFTILKNIYLEFLIVQFVLINDDY